MLCGNETRSHGYMAPGGRAVRRAEAILAELATTEDGRQALASRSRVLEAGLDARFTALADALAAVLSALEGRPPARESLAALADLDHARAVLTEPTRFER